MTYRDIVMAQIQHEETKVVPYALRKCDDEKLNIELSRYYGGDWTKKLTPYVGIVKKIDNRNIEPIDEIHSRDAFGSIYRTDKSAPTLVEPALKEPSLKNFNFPTIGHFINPSVKENIMKSLSEYPESFTLLILGWGMQDQALDMRGFENCLMDTLVNQDFHQELISHLTSMRMLEVEQCADIPVDSIMFGDDWGTQQGVLLGPDLWRKYIKPAWAKVYEAVHAQNKIVISHCCGSVVDIMNDIIEIGLDVLESVQPEAAGMNPYALKKKYGDKITFWGGLGSQSTIQFGTPIQIKKEVQRLSEEMSKGGGYILGAAKGFQPGTPLQNAIAVIDSFLDQNDG